MKIIFFNLKYSYTGIRLGVPKTGPPAEMKLRWSDKYQSTTLALCNKPSNTVVSRPDLLVLIVKNISMDLFSVIWCLKFCSQGTTNPLDVYG